MLARSVEVDYNPDQSGQWEDQIIKEIKKI